MDGGAQYRRHFHEIDSSIVGYSIAATAIALCCGETIQAHMKIATSMSQQF